MHLVEFASDQSRGLLGGGANFMPPPPPKSSKVWNISKRTPSFLGYRERILGKELFQKWVIGSWYPGVKIAPNCALDLEAVKFNSRS